MLRDIEFIENFVIMVTGRCNLSCDHCLRGEPVPDDISDEVLEEFFSKTKFIYELTLSGGEPTLAIPRMQRILELMKKHGTALGAVYVVTNGTGDIPAFLHTYLDYCLYATDCGYYDNDNMSGIALSQDRFHGTDPREMRKVDAMLRIFARYDPKAKKTDFTKVNLLREGRAKENFRENQTRELTVYDPTVTEAGDGINIEGEVISLDMYGNLHKGCDFSWDDKSYVITNILSDSAWVQTIYNKFGEE